MIVLSFYDYTTEAVKPWADAGYDCYCFDIQHEGTNKKYYGQGSITTVHADLHKWDTYMDLLTKFKADDVSMVLGFPVCTDLAVSGAKWFVKKEEENPGFQLTATQHAKDIADFANRLGVPYMIENPVSVLATLWRKPNYSFHPYEYGGYIADTEAEHPLYPAYIAPKDAYPKKTCLWTGNGFIMPPKKPVEPEAGHSRQHLKLGGKSMKTKNIRSATPRGFAKAVYLANYNSGVNTITED